MNEEEVLARHQELTRKRSVLSAELDNQLQLSKALHSRLDRRIGTLGSKLAGIEDSAQSAGSDDQLALIETRNNEMKLSTQSLVDQQLQRNSASLFLQKKQRKQKPIGAGGVGRPRGSGAQGMTAAQLKKQRAQKELSQQYSAGLTGVPADPNEPLYCVCRNVFFGEMVGCDDPDCVVEWFHFGCVGLTEAPEQWFCDDCAVKRTARGAGGSGRGRGGKPSKIMTPASAKGKGKGKGKPGRPRKYRDSSDESGGESEDFNGSDEEF